MFREVDLCFLSCVLVDLLIIKRVESVTLGTEVGESSRHLFPLSKWLIENSHSVDWLSYFDDDHVQCSSTGSTSTISTEWIRLSNAYSANVRSHRIFSLQIWFFSFNSRNVFVLTNNRNPWLFEYPWSNKLCSCCTDVKQCCYAFFCPCCFVCQLYKRTGENMCTCLCPGSLFALRAKIRTAFRIEVSFN